MFIQPFGHKLFRGVFRRHLPFISRTVLVKDDKVEDALRLMNKLMGQEKLLDIIRRTKYFEKPCKQRTRYSYERCKAIYDEDMRRKIAFVMRKNRADPFVGQY